jgi:starch synthase
MLGSGDPVLEARMTELAERLPDFFVGLPQFSNPLAHRIMAACDILLMPSRFEPCGLNQLYAMRYGTVPVACATGGLNDTIDDVSPFPRGHEAMGTGWTFAPPTVPALVRAMKAVVQVRIHIRFIYGNGYIRFLALFGASRVSNTLTATIAYRITMIVASELLVHQW